LTAQSFIKGAVVLSIAGLVSKLLGALYRIPFFRVVGSEGMGLYQMAYPLYTILLAVSSAGIPVAISKLISESLARRDYGDVAKIIRVSMLFIIVTSGLLSAALYRGAGFLACEVLHDPRAVYGIMAISPAVFFVGILSVLRGYFQGFQEMAPTAYSQVLEQFIRVITVLIGAYIFLPRGVEFAAAAATFGAVTGAATGALFLTGLYLLRSFFIAAPASFAGFRGSGSAGVFQILYRVIVLALPISLGGLVLPVMQTLDALTVPVRLHLAGYSVSRAAELYGQLAGGAVTLINLPTVITISLAAALVPEISRLVERRNFYEVRRQIDSAVQITVLVCLPASIGLAVLAAPIANLLYKCPEAGIPLVYVAPAALLLGLHQTTAGILQGMGKTFIPVINLALGGVVKFIVNYTLTAVPQIGIIGAAAGTVCGFLMCSYMNCVFIRSLTGWKPNFTAVLIKPAVAATIMAVGVYFSYGELTIIMGSSWATLASVLLGAVIYSIVLLATGMLRQTGMPIPVIIPRLFGRR